MLGYHLRFGKVDPNALDRTADPCDDFYQYAVGGWRQTHPLPAIYSRYGRFEDGTFKRGGTSLSVPASDRARAGDRAQPNDAFVTSLPASQQCS